MRQSRVLHILPHHGGGGEVYVSMLERTLDFSHERFYLSAGRTPASAATSIPARLPWLVRRALAADVIHVHGDSAAIITIPLLILRPSVITTHGLHLLRRSGVRRRAAVRLGLRAAVAASRAVIATSTAELYELASIARKRDESKLQVIFNGVDSPPASTEAERQATRAELGIVPGSTLGIFAGELESRKEPLLAIAATERAQRDGLSFVLAVAGAGPLSATVQRRASDAIRPLGFRSDLSRLLASADVFLLPSSREGMSLALLEAMSHGLAVIAADTPGNAEAIADAGLLFAAGDAAALGDAVTLIVSDPGLRIRLGGEAKRRALEHFGAERFRAETAEIYAQVRASVASAKIAP